jgi:hypothetical protein
MMNPPFSVILYLICETVKAGVGYLTIQANSKEYPITYGPIGLFSLRSAARRLLSRTSISNSKDPVLIHDEIEG